MSEAKRIDLYGAVLNFYSLQAIEAAACPLVNEFRHSHERWLRDFTDVSQRFTGAFARALFDYLALAAFGEARHSRRRASKTIPDLIPCHDRGEAMDMAREYDPRLFLPKLEALFGKAYWARDYGGPAWAKIACTARLYGKLPDAAFIDHCVDLSHNGGLCFDKYEARIFSLSVSRDTYLALLDHKRFAEPDAFLKAYLGLRTVSRHVLALASRAANLGLLPSEVVPSYPLANLCDGGGFEDVVEVVTAYRPVHWGDKQLGDIVDSCARICIRCGNVIDDDEGYVSVEGDEVCYDCFDNSDEFVVCERCGDPYYKEHTFCVGRKKWGELVYLCEYCYEIAGDEYEEMYGGDDEDSGVVGKEEKEKEKEGGKFSYCIVSNIRED